MILLTSNLEMVSGCMF